MIVLAQLPWIVAIDIKMSFEPLFHDKGIPLALMGMFIVFMALLFVISFISSLPRIMGMIESFSPSGEHAPAPPPVAPQESESPEELIAVIAAAVAATLDQPHRIIRTREITAQEMAWPQQGRLQIQASHKPHN